MKEFITTGQAARVAGVSPRTISKVFDDGLIAGFRVKADRRILVSSFRDYLMSLATHPDVKVTLERRLNAELTEDKP